MKRLITLIIATAALSLPASGGTILLSGDANITNALTVGNGFPIDTGNQTFFNNVLGSGTSVLIDENSGFFGPFSAPRLNNYYNSLSGVSSSLLGGGGITAASLVGIDLLASIFPDTPYSGSEIAALNGFLGNGGTVFFMGDQFTFATENGNINDALLQLGSGMSIIPGTFTPNVLTVATGSEIAAHPLTAGVSTFSYQRASIVQVAGGTALFFDQDSRPFLAVETVSGKAVPDGGMTLLLLFVGLLSMAFVRRRVAGA